MLSPFLHRISPFRSSLILPPFLQHPVVKLLILLLLLWGFFHLSGDLIVEGLEEKKPEQYVVPSFRGSAMDGQNNANTASQQSNSNSLQAIENSKNDHYATDPSPSKKK